MMEQQNWQALQERVGWLERRLKFTLLLAVGGWMLFGVIWALLLLGLKQGTIQFRDLRARRLAIVDERGRERIELAVIPDKEDPEGVAGLVLADVAKRAGVLISVSSIGGATLSLSDTTGRPRIILMITPPFETPAFTFYNAEGKLCADLYIDPRDGAAKLRFLDAKGQVLFKAP